MTNLQNATYETGLELADSPRPSHVVMLVGNDVSSDTRVKKVAASVSRMGARVTVIGTTPEPTRYETRMGDVRIVRVPVKAQYRLSQGKGPELPAGNLRASHMQAKERYEHAAREYWLDKREHAARIGRLKADLAGVAAAEREAFLTRREALDTAYRARIVEIKDRQASLAASTKAAEARGHGPGLGRLSGSLTRSRSHWLRRRLVRQLEATRTELRRHREREREAFESRRRRRIDEIRAQMDGSTRALAEQRARLEDLRAEYEEAREAAVTQPVLTDVDARLEELPVVDWRDALPTLHDFERAIGPAIDELQPDLIHAHDMGMIGIAERAAARRRVRGDDVLVIYDAHEYVRGLQGYMDAERLSGYINLEDEYIESVDRVVTVSQPLADLLEKDHDLRHPPSVVLNAPLVGGRTSSGVQGVRERIGLPSDVPLLVYSGRVHPTRRVTTLVQALAHLPEDTHVAIVGEPSPAYRRQLLKEARDIGCEDRLHLLGYVASGDVVEHLRSATAGVQLLLPIPNHRLALPNKFFEYLHAGLPVINSDIGETASLIRQYGFGEVFDSDDPEGLAAAATAVIKDVGRYRSSLQANSDLLERFTWDAQEAALFDVYCELLGPSQVRRPETSLTDISEVSVGIGEGHTGVAHLAIGARNMAGQAWQWMKALERHTEGVETHVVTLARSRNKLEFPTDTRVTAEEWGSLAWQTRQVYDLTRNATHVLLESGGGMFGTLTADRFEADAAILRAHGVHVGLVFHGSDVRDPSRHRGLEVHSPFDPSDPLTVTLQEQVDRLLPRVAVFDGPKFVSTQDLLDYVPDATWLPVVVDVDRWAEPPVAALDHAGPPTVLHLATSSRLKGSDDTLAIARRLADDGTIRLREVDQVAPDDLPEMMAEIDVFIDGTRLGDYGVLACQALAMNRVVVGNVAPRVRQRIPSEVPIVQADPSSLEDVLRNIARSPHEYSEKARAGRDFVIQYHDGTHSSAVLSQFLAMGAE